ncbi:hypothetical protein G7Y79_00027g059970 [Physcia stellaris]|nr:hypothetical protein G7Y79_00027g059970 [Physcia stellaris]
MLVQRFSQQSARRLLAHTSQPFVLSRLAPPAALATNRYRIQSRPAATQTIKDSSAYHILEAQRRNRPVSPHLLIYKPQISWYLSALNRITGSTLSGGFYLFGAAYLCAPLFGWHLDSASMAAAFGSLPVAVKVMLKFGVAMPFTFHSFNGVRHLIWDTGRELSNKGVQRTGWTVVGLSVVGSGILAVL